MRDDQFIQKVANAPDLTVDEQQRAGTVPKGDLDEEYRNFLSHVSGLIERKEIDPFVPESFLNKDIYDSLDEDWQNKVDRVLPNMADLVRKMVEYYHADDAPKESPMFQTMIESLWHMKQKIEKHHDVFKF